MTFKDLQKLVESQSSSSSPELQRLVGRLRDKPFWIWDQLHHRQEDIKTKGDCCFNHIIGLPTKHNHRKPLYDYEMQVIKALLEDGYLNSTTFNKVQYSFKLKHAAVLKAAGLGITELILRFIAWLCLRNDDLKGSQMVIITGPRIELSISLMDRLRGLLLRQNITFSDKETVLNLNDVRIEAFPSFHSSTARGLPNVSLVFVDEASFIPDHQVDEIMDIMLRYVPKSNPYLIVVSTPNKAGDFMDRLMSEPIETSPFKRLWLDYTYGLDKIYTRKEIEKIKNTRSFEREFNLKFISTSGNCFNQSSINRAVELANKYPLTINKNAKHSCGCDPGFGSSSCGFCVLEYSDGIIKCVFADQYERSSYNDMVQKIWEIRNLVTNLNNVYIDGANVEFIDSVKQELGEDNDWHRIHDKIAWCKKNSLNISDYMQVVPVNFAQEGASMLSHCKNILEHEDPFIAINSKWDKLITGLRGAVATEYKLNKNETPYPDLVDAFRLAMKFFNLKKED